MNACVDKSDLRRLDSTLLVAVHLATFFLLLLLPGRPRDEADANPRSSTYRSNSIRPGPTP